LYSVIGTLGLNQVLYAPIGDEKSRGISGGERKRVNIGLELVSDPCILFLDEPTSGLDSSSSRDVVQCLRQIAATGITVVAVLHQPSYEIFSMTDDLLLLGKGGRTVYMGPSKDAEPYFEKLGFVCPPRMNPSDFFMEVVSGKVVPAGSKDFDLQELFEMWYQTHAKSEHSITLPKKEVADYPKVLESAGVPESSPSKKLRRQRVHQVFQRVKEGVQNVCHSVRALFQRNKFRPRRPFPVIWWHCFVRALNQMLNIKELMLQTVLHLLCGFFMSVAAKDLSFVGPLSPAVSQYMCPFSQIRFCGLPIQDHYPSTGQLLCWTIGFAGITAGAITFGTEKVVAWREASSGLSSLAYFSSKCVADLPKIVLAAVTFSYSFTTFYTPQGDQTHILAIFLMFYFNAWAIGYLLSMVTSLEMTALIGVAVSTVWAVVFGGVQPNISEVKRDYGAASFLWQISYARWGVEAFYITEIEAVDYMQIQLQLKYLGFDMDNFNKCMVAMFAIGMGWRVLAFMTMKLTNRDKKK